MIHPRGPSSKWPQKTSRIQTMDRRMTMKIKLDKTIIYDLLKENGKINPCESD